MPYLGQSQGSGVGSGHVVLDPHPRSPFSEFYSDNTTDPLLPLSTGIRVKGYDCLTKLR